MKNLSILLIILTLLLCFGGKQSFAQKETEETVNIKLSIPREKFIKVDHVPVYKNLDKVKVISSGFDITTKDKNDSVEIRDYGSITVECPECRLTSQYRFLVIANAIDIEMIELSFWLQFKNKKSCDNIKQLLLFKNKPTVFKSKCGVKILLNYP